MIQIGGMVSGKDTQVASGRLAPRHPIGVVAQRTGLTPDVLRVWERRYQVVQPHRTDNGQRLYSDADVERLQLLQRATSQGRAISQLVDLEDGELRELIRTEAPAAPQAASGEPAPPPPHAAAYIELALERAIRLDGDGLESLLRRLAVLWGTPVFLDAMAAPLFRRIGEEWHDRRLKPAQEHLATAVMRNVLTSLVGDLSPQTAAPKLVVATLPDERHEIGALLVASSAAGMGWRVTYLGPDLPAEDIAGAAQESGARAVAISSVLPLDEAGLVEDVRTLREQLPAHVDLLVGGRGASEVAEQLEGMDVTLMTDLNELRDWLRRTM